MHRIDSLGTAVALPVPAAVGATVGYFTKGDPGSGTPATVVSDDWLNAIQEEMMAVLASVGIAADKTSQVQLLAAIRLIAAGGASTLSKAFADTGYTFTAAAKNAKWNTAGGNCVQNLPAAAGVDGQEFFVVKTSGDANTVTITPNGAETINGDATLVLDTQWSSAKLKSIGTGYVVI